MVRWENIPELNVDLVGYLRRQNGVVTYVEIAQYFEKVAADDGELTNLDGEFRGLRSAKLRSCNGACELLVGIRRVTRLSDILMLVAIKHYDEAAANAPLCSDPFIQLRLSLGNLELLKRK